MKARILNTETKKSVNITLRDEFDIEKRANMLAQELRKRPNLKEVFPKKLKHYQIEWSY